MSLIEGEGLIDNNDPIDMTEQDVPNDGMDFTGDPHANTPDQPKPIALDPNGTYQFGDITVTGQEMIQKIVAPNPLPSSEVDELKQTVIQLTTQVQSLAQPTAVAPTPEQPVSQLNNWMQTRFGDSPEGIDSLTPQDLVQGLTAMQQDTTRLITQLAEQNSPERMNEQMQSFYQQQQQQQGQQMQLQQSKEGAVEQAVNLFVANKAQALGVTAAELQPKYEYIARTIKNSGTYLLSDNPGNIQQYALDELQAWDKHQQGMVEVQSSASAESVKRQNRNLVRESQRQIKNLANPNGRAQVIGQFGPPPQNVVQQPQPQQLQQTVAPNPLYTRTGQIDEDAVLQSTKQSGTIQRY